jgi:hypothetical protein
VVERAVACDRDGLEAVERLREEVVRAALDGLHRLFDAAVPGHEHELGARCDAAQPRKTIDRVAVGQPHVEQANVRRVGELLLRLAQRPRLHDGPILQDADARGADHLLVIDDEHGLHLAIVPSACVSSHA